MWLSQEDGVSQTQEEEPQEAGFVTALTLALTIVPDWYITGT